MAEKECSCCGQFKANSEFNRIGRVCRTCCNARQRANRKQSGNVATRRYEKTTRGFLMRTYRNMESRVKGIQWRKAHLYAGKSLLDRETFYQWSIHDVAFTALFMRWGLAGYVRKLTPSIDRIDSSKGYELDNMRWVTHSENSRAGNRSRIAQGRHIHQNAPPPPT